MGIIYFVLLLSIIVSIHELGHLVAAKIFKVYCYEYSIGMGPKIFSKKFKETEYSLRALPLGGFVAMAGEEDDDRGLDVPYERTIKAIAGYKQIIIMLAGVFMNFILALFIMYFITLSNGFYNKAPEPIVAGVLENSPAKAAGFEVNDRIVKVVLEDGTTIKPDTFYDILPFTQTSKGQVKYQVERGNSLVELEVEPQYNEEEQVYLVGIQMPPSTQVKVNPLNAFTGALNYLVDTTKTMVVGIIRLFKGVGLNQVSGPIGIYNITKQQASLGIKNFLMLVALISMNVGIFNLLPLPVLDGGRAIITLFETILNKKLNRKIETAIMAIAWVLLLSLMIFATWQDLVRIF